MTWTSTASQSLGDPAGSAALVAAVQWLQGTLLGTIATTVAIIAVAATGMLMLSGRIDVKRGASVVVGCFILFGAPSIAAGIASLGDDGATYAPLPVPSTPSQAELPPKAAQPAAPYDRYAGAAVPDT